jgi:hypothetical protein
VSLKTISNICSLKNNLIPKLLFADLEWPVDDEALSSAMHAAIDQLLTLDPEQRPGIEGVQQMELFSKIKWMEQLQEPAPFVPEPTSNTDTAYFEGRNETRSHCLFILMQTLFHFSPKHTATMDCIQL